MATEWAVQFEGHEPFRLGDIPIEDIQQIADKHGVRWGYVYLQPTAESGVWLDIVAYVAGKIGVEFETPTTTRDTFESLDLSTQVDDDLPKMWVDGDPPTADEPKTV